MASTQIITAAELTNWSDSSRGTTCCPLCGSRDLHDFFAARDLPVHVCVLGETRAEARRAPRGNVLLSFCHACGFVHNRAFEPAKATFNPTYEASLVHSATFRTFIDELVQRLVGRYDLRGKRIVEVGCGSGYFLQQLCAAGGNHGVGFDPSVVEEATQDLEGGGTVRLVRDYFTQKYADVPCDFLCCQSVMEDPPRPVQFARQLRRILGDRRVHCYFEVFNALRAFDAQETFSIHYEQCNYFGRDTFARMFSTSGFEVLEADTCYEGDQYVYVEAVTASRPAPESPGPAARRQVPRAIADFSDCHRRKMSHWQARLARLRASGGRAVLWGSGGKGVSFLNMLPTEGVIEYVVDINPRRQGKFIPGAGQAIVEPEHLATYQPHLVILSNALYEREIREQLADLNVECEVAVA